MVILMIYNRNVLIKKINVTFIYLKFVLFLLNWRNKTDINMKRIIYAGKPHVWLRRLMLSFIYFNLKFVLCILNLRNKTVKKQLFCLLCSTVNKYSYLFLQSISSKCFFTLGARLLFIPSPAPSTGLPRASYLKCFIGITIRDEPRMNQL